MYKYHKKIDGSPSEYILRLNEDDTTSTIPNNPANSDWQAYQAWLEADPENQPLPADEE